MSYLLLFNDADPDPNFHVDADPNPDPDRHQNNSDPPAVLSQVLQMLKIWIFWTLKVPKCEIFDGSDFHDFYTIKSLWEGNFGVKNKM